MKSNSASFAKPGHPESEDFVFPVRKSFWSFWAGLGFEDFLTNLDADIDWPFRQILLPFVDDESVNEPKWECVIGVWCEGNFEFDISLDFLIEIDWAVNIFS